MAHTWPKPITNTTTASAERTGVEHSAPTGRARHASRTAAPLIALLPLAWVALTDGDKRVSIPRPGEPGANASRAALLIDPNTAPWWELTALPRIGEVLARKIVAYRETHQAAHGESPVFASAEDLQGVPGIGPKTVARLRPHLTVGQTSTVPRRDKR